MIDTERLERRAMDPAIRYERQQVIALAVEAIEAKKWARPRKRPGDGAERMMVIFHMYFFEGRNPRECGLALGVSGSQVQALIDKMLRVIRKRMKFLEPKPEPEPEPEPKPEPKPNKDIHALPANASRKVTKTWLSAEEAALFLFVNSHRLAFLEEAGVAPEYVTGRGYRRTKLLRWATACEMRLRAQDQERRRRAGSPHDQ